MSTTRRQDTEFADAVFPLPSSDNLLAEAIDWIKGNLGVEDVFDDVQIKQYVQANLEIDFLYSETTLLNYVAGTWEPADVFSTNELSAWAEANGYTKET